MNVFVTSFRSRALAKDWRYHVWLMERAVQSMLAQTQGEMRVAIGCHEIPDSEILRDSRVHFIPVSISPPARDNDDMCVDKVLKLSAGTEWALAQGCSYVIFTDADDLVSNRIGGFIDRHQGSSGWYCGAEMFYAYGGRLLRYFAIPGKSSGPCVIVRADLLSFATPPYSGAWADLVRDSGESRYLDLLARHGVRTNVLAAVGIAHYREYMEREGTPLAPLPFPANVVINHPDSTATVPGGIGSYDPSRTTQRPAWRKNLGRVKSIVTKVKTLRVVDRALRTEFSIPNNDAIPPQYWSRGSIFWR